MVGGKVFSATSGMLSHDGMAAGITVDSLNRQRQVGARLACGCLRMRVWMIMSVVGLLFCSVMSGGVRAVSGRVDQIG